MADGGFKQPRLGKRRLLDHHHIVSRLPGWSLALGGNV